MANPQTKLYVGKLSENILVLGSSGSGKMSSVQEIATNSIFGNLEGVYWVSGVKLSKNRETEIESCFEPKVDFSYPSDEYDLNKIFNDLKNIYREKEEKKKQSEVSGKGRKVDRGYLIALDDATGLAGKSPSFIKFLTMCRKFGYSILHIFHEPAISSSKWRDIISQTQIFCVFPWAMDLIINYLAKFIARGTGNRYVSRQQLWLTNLVDNIEKQSGFSCFCLNKRPEVSGAARYRSMVENPETQCCYLNSSTSDKLFNTSLKSSCSSV